MKKIQKLRVVISNVCIVLITKNLSAFEKHSLSNLHIYTRNRLLTCLNIMESNHPESYLILCLTIAIESSCLPLCNEDKLFSGNISGCLPSPNSLNSSFLYFASCQQLIGPKVGMLFS
jgi:hypothetical protein